MKIYIKNHNFIFLKIEQFSYNVIVLLFYNNLYSKNLLYFLIKSLKFYFGL